MVSPLPSKFNTILPAEYCDADF